MTRQLQTPAKALSLTQPMAWALAAGYKDIENRGWATPFRGRFFIHASKKGNLDHYEWIEARTGIMNIDLPPFEKLTHGAIIGEGSLVGVCTGSPSPWFEGKYGFMIKDALLYDTPIYCRGQLGFFKVNDIYLEESTGRMVASTTFSETFRSS